MVFSISILPPQNSTEVYNETYMYGELKIYNIYNYL